MEKLNLSPGKYHSRHVKVTDDILRKKRIAIKTRELKSRRNLNKKIKSSLRHRKKNIEGITYESGCALLTEPAIPISQSTFDPESDNDNCGYPFGFGNERIRQ